MTGYSGSKVQDTLTSLPLEKAGLSRKVLNVVPTSAIGWLPLRAVIRQARLRPGTTKVVLFRLKEVGLLRERSRDGIKSYQRTAKGTRAIQ